MLKDWANKWGIPQAAIDDLVSLTVTPDAPFDEIGDGSESRLQSFIRLEGSEHGVTLFRNNTGAGIVRNPETGVESFLRWGLLNDSKAVNEKFKPGDLIGVRPVLIKPDHVGHTIGQFVSRECKKPGWKFTGKGREAGQMRWATLINNMGGDAKFVSGPGSF